MATRRVARAKIFWSGRSQAVRLPKEFRLPGRELRVRRVGGGVLLEPVAEDWTWLDEVHQPLDADFVAAAQEQPRAPDRADLDKLWP